MSETEKDPAQPGDLRTTPKSCRELDMRSRIAEFSPAKDRLPVQSRRGKGGSSGGGEADPKKAGMAMIPFFKGVYSEEKVPCSIRSTGSESWLDPILCTLEKLNQSWY
jgi:hypothetical protein